MPRISFSALRVIAWLLACAASGCATHYQAMMNPQGQIVTCQTSALGLFAVFFSDYFQAECVKARSAEGFREVRLSGAIGADFSETLAISSIVAGSPAQEAGLRVGDVLVSIDGNRPLNLVAANEMMVGPPGRTVKIVCDRDGKQETFLVSRRPWTDVYGAPK